MVITLMAAVSLLFIIPQSGNKKPLESRKLPDLLLKSIREARYQASQNGYGVWLGFDKETASMNIRNEHGAPLGNIPIMNSGYSFDLGGLSMEFYKIMPELELKGEPVYESEESAVESIYFSPSGVSAPFRIRIQNGFQDFSYRISGLSGRLEIEDSFSL